jgi:hypothetical protein
MLLACRWHLSRTFTARQLHTKSSFALGLKEEASLNPYHVPEGYLLPGLALGTQYIVSPIILILYISIICRNSEARI